MSADEMFEKLGYLINKIYNKDKRYITYVKNEYLFIKFDTKNKTVDTFLNGNHETSFEIEMEELKAINKKCEELGWLKEVEELKIDEMFKKYTDGFNDGIDSVKKKIENEIEELKEMKLDNDNVSDGMRRYAILILQDLLKEV